MRVRINRFGGIGSIIGARGKKKRLKDITPNNFDGIDKSVAGKLPAVRAAKRIGRKIRKKIFNR